MKLTVACVLLLVGSALAWQKPKFCNENECPEFTEVEASGYSVREYVESKWVVTGFSASFWTYLWEQGSAFMRLFRYISGDNAGDEKIAMTTPVRTVVYSECEDCEYTHTMGFFVPADADDVPMPTNTELEVQQLPSKKYYVRSFGGWATQMRIRNQYNSLKRDLERDGKEYVKAVYIVSGYNSPMEFRDRHNEIMVEVIEN